MTAAYVLGVVAPLVVLGMVVELLRRGRLRERHAVWWLVFGLLALAGGLFPALLTKLASLTGVELPVNLVFFVAISVAFLVFLQHSAELTKLEAKTRTLAERVSLLELELRQARGDSPETAGLEEAPSGPDTGEIEN